jgi:DNA-binding NarL/FixJ family response regulator
VALSYRGEQIGRLLVAPRTVSGRLSEHDRRLLEDIAHPVALTVNAVELSASLQRAREQLVTTREEERRRLRRDLHDGLGPTLAGMVMQLDAASNVLRRDPGAVEPVLTGLRSAAQDAVCDIRQLVDELRPRALDELGLIGAIRECAERFCSAEDEDGLIVSLEAPAQLPSLPAAVEVAALRIVQEAIANVARHSHARRCRVRMAANGALEVKVQDDGRGLPIDHTPGVGLASMKERAAEVGGTLTLLIVDDHPAFRAGLRLLLESLDDFEVEVVGEAENGEQALELAIDLSPDVIVMDLQMPGLGGIEATRRVVAAAPHVRVLMLTMFEDETSVFAALRAGAQGYILKGAGQEQLARAIRAVAEGESIFSPGIANRVIESFARTGVSQRPLAFPQLTAREREVLDLIARGLSNPEITRQLVLSPKTVRNHVSNILAKLQARDRSAAIVRAREAGLGLHTDV